ncbi:DUF5317 domain-containing protein [Peptoniphilus sp. MSJ-1]|uniref:DUF5317 domain-containing protein n=1 Tax=Peptoniphilus ovalis TaxID=2841503 RepID=A0ABS6FG59_9FIRM|nr:DUF5317 domain-containing protein [Peptoniphilus ovalis]MBU5669156.1 DUF5317 domain-containing protein [Peptoniphilus ovalis]
MIIESALIAILILFFIKDKNLDNLKSFKYKNISLVFMGIILLFSINSLTGKDFGKVTDFVVKYYKYFHILSIFLIGISLLSNYRNFGFVITGIGIFLNVIPIIFNGKMPVSLSALHKIGNERVIDILINNRSLSHGIFEKPKFYFLSDIIPINKIIGSSTIISIGDIFISLGLIIAVILIVKDRGVK